MTWFSRNSNDELPLWQHLDPGKPPPTAKWLDVPGRQDFMTFADSLTRDNLNFPLFRCICIPSMHPLNFSHQFLCSLHLSNSPTDSLSLSSSDLPYADTKSTSLAAAARAPSLRPLNTTSGMKMRDASLFDLRITLRITMVDNSCLAGLICLFPTSLCGALTDFCCASCLPQANSTHTNLPLTNACNSPTQLIPAHLKPTQLTLRTT